jgi:hypothetical protein
MEPGVFDHELQWSTRNMSVGLSARALDKSSSSLV